VSGACSCGGTSCDGCCSKGNCVPSSTSTCGVGGGLCVKCDANQACNIQGRCVCDSSSCPNGCCDANDQCRTSTTTTCGISGEDCISCSLSKATANCENGQCVIASCNTNYSDCDNDTSNGCETLLTSTSNCGSCGNKCTARENATSPTCVDGICGDKCNYGYQDNGTICDLKIWWDSKSNLSWEIGPSGGDMSWQSAISYCNARSVYGYSDWRLPTISELRSLIRGCVGTVTGGPCKVTDSCARSDESCHTVDCGMCTENGGPDDGCYRPEPLTGTCGRSWSSTRETTVTDRTNVWYVNFAGGYVMSIDTANADGYVSSVLCVRTGR